MDHFIASKRTLKQADCVHGTCIFIVYKMYFIYILYYVINIFCVLCIFTHSTVVVSPINSSYIPVNIKQHSYIILSLFLSSFVLCFTPYVGGGKDQLLFLVMFAHRNQSAEISCVESTSFYILFVIFVFVKVGSS